jgi:hypothetical protein
MGINYFSIMDAADKEMAQSAMLRFLLYRDPFFMKRCFPAFGGKADGLSITLEVPCERKRLDLVARSQDGHILVVENKFKSFPNCKQLATYDAILKKCTPNPVKYLLCFDDTGVPSCNRERSQAPKAQSWHVITYRQIQKAIQFWLESPERNADDETVILCRHYAEYLKAYYEEYERVFADYSLLFPPKSEKEAKNGFSLADITSASSNLNFWRKLALHHVGNNIAATPGMDVEFDHGVAKTPVINILPEGWNRAATPLLCVQIQDLEAKLYMKDLKKCTHNTREAVLAYAAKLQKSLPEAGRVEVKDMRTQVITKQSNSFAIYKEQVLSGATPVAALPEKILAFHRRMQDTVHNAEPFD